MIVIILLMAVYLQLHLIMLPQTTGLLRNYNQPFWPPESNDLH